MATTTYGTPYVQSSDLVSSYPGTSSTLATRIDAVSYAGNGLNDQTGTSYTLVLTDVGKTVTLSNAAAVTVTIPANASVAAPTGSIVRFVNKGAGTVTIQPTGGVTLNGGNLTLAQYAAVQIVKLATDTWGVVESTGSPAGLTLITAQSFSAVSSVSINSCFSATYDNYVIQCVLTSGTGGQPTVRLRASGTDATTNYNWQDLYASGPTVNGQRLTGQTSYRLGELSTGRAATQLFVYGPAIAAATQLRSVNANDIPSIYEISGIHTTASAYDGVTYAFPGSSTGTIRVYGYRNS